MVCAPQGSDLDDPVLAERGVGIEGISERQWCDAERSDGEEGESDMT
jgi:hypothetical protein